MKQLDVSYDGKCLVLKNTPVIFSILLKNYTGCLVPKLSTEDLGSNERLLFNEWKRIFIFRFKNENIKAMRDDESARLNYENAEQLACDSAAYMLGSFTPIAISCDTSIEQLNRILYSFEKFIFSDVDKNCFMDELKLYMADFIESIPPMYVFRSYSFGEFELPVLCGELLPREFYVPPILQDSLDLSGKWKHGMAQIESIYPIGTRVKSDVLSGINLQQQ